MTEFWEQAFRNKQEIWGEGPTNSAVAAAKIFNDNGFNNVLIPGIGYGRNAQPFLNFNMDVTGVEISETAIHLAEKHFGNVVKIYHGSVTDMPFDNVSYDGIFCHALIHLLNKADRKKLIADCYRQLAENGLMFFTAITKKSPTYGQGILIAKDTFEQFGGLNMFFYDEDTIAEEFSAYGLYQVDEITDNYPFHFIQCGKSS
ncbi:class I SAM-dependent methyltransferase [Mucilaginibacter auburnensis]|uniref:Methyltransferase family protein n=1 Tax=Mucilaginibacter auburnensis TaxID=1457233 RepID=A0A2H9VLV2_9SPHI|nr:class I SAM-dependent methyltransferase [Mucilaginibacter auburnensis]PJJ79319.1 methyltransferase family protein [Mucilaginibacter auburnensis]